MSEYGCNKGATRQFEEVSALYSTEMTSVYSGGLVYEYSQEVNNFGLVSLSGSTPSPQPDFANLKSALAKTPDPSGNGGAKSSGTPSQCPAQSSDWSVSNDALPAVPAGAVKYFSSGAGTGAGLNGAGSQNAGGVSTGTATPGSGSATATAGGASSTATSSKKSAASTMHAQELPLKFIVCGLAIALSSFFGATLL